MFSKPEAGWCTFTIEDFEFTFSYIMNTPQDFIDQLVNALENRTTFSIFLDGEGPFCMLASDRYHLYIISDKIPDDEDNGIWENYVEPRLKIFEINIKDFVQEFIDDIEKYEKEFSFWNAFYNRHGQEKYDLSKLKKALGNYI
jgi:hypothetical protein